MSRFIKRGLFVVLTVSVAFFGFSDQSVRQVLRTSTSVETARAGAITSPTIVASSVVASATGVIDTVTLTTATAIPVGGRLVVSFMSPPGPPVQFQDFSGVTIATGSNAGFSGFSVFYSGMSFNVNVTATTAIAAGAVVLKLGGIVNPTSGSVLPVNIFTQSSTGATLDGNQFVSPDSAPATLMLGTVKLSGKVTDSTTGTGVAGLRLELHPGPNSSPTNYQSYSATTDSSGNYQFIVSTNGTLMLEKSPGVDPSNPNSATLSQYAAFDQREVVISDTPQVINIALVKASKIITGKVVYAGTTTGVRNAMVNAGSFSGAFTNSSTGSDGTFTLRMAVDGTKSGGGQMFFMVQPQMQQQGGGAPSGGTPPGGGTPPAPPVSDTDFGSYQSQITAFTQGITVAETFAMGNIEVPKADATVTGKFVNSDGTALGNVFGGLFSPSSHSFTPLQVASNGTFTAKLVSGRSYEVNSFDQTGAYYVAPKRFTPKAGTTDLGTIPRSKLTKTVTLTAFRADGGTKRAIANAQGMCFAKGGPPFFSTTDSNGVATVKVPDDYKGRCGVMPGGGFGGGGKPGEGGEKPPAGGKIGLIKNAQEFVLQTLIGSAKAAEVQILAAQAGDAGDANQLFPIDGFKELSAGGSGTFEFGKPDSEFTVKTVNSSGTLITNGGFVDISSTSGFRMGCPTAGGVGTCRGFKGKEMKAKINFPPNVDYAGKTTTFTPTGVAGQVVSLTVVPKDVTVSGEVQDGSNSNAVIKDATLQIMVGAFSKDGDFSMGAYNPATGTHTTKIAADTDYHFGVTAGDPSQGIKKGGYVPNISSNAVSGASGKEVKFNVKLSKVDATITVTVKDDKGAVVEGVTVIANNALADIVGPEGPGGPGGPGGGPGGPGPGGPAEGPEFGFNAITDATGKAVINVAPDKYQIVVNARDLGYFTTGVVQAEPASGKNVDVTVTLAKANSTLEFEVNNKDGNDMTSGEVTLYNELGTMSFNTEVGTDGKVKIAVPADADGQVYTVKAGKDSPESGKVEESKSFKVTAYADKTTTTTLKADQVDDDALAEPVSQEVSSSSAASLVLAKGGTEQAKVSLPSGALSSSSSSSSDSSSSSSSSPLASMVPLDAELPQTKVAQTYGTGFEMSASDSSGNEITSLSGVATASIHLDKDQVPTGTNATNVSKLEARYYDADAGSWSKVQTSTAVFNGDGSVDVNFTTNHLTTFAVTTSTDTTAPAAPSSITATAKANNAIGLGWTNPTDTDFASTTIYRSTTAGDLGTAVHTSVTGTSKDDTGLTSDTTYYYTVRAVDSSGNESTNTAQVSAKARTGTLPKTGNIFSTGFMTSNSSDNFFSGLLKVLRNAR